MGVSLRNSKGLFTATHSQREGSDLSAANFSWKVLTHAFASVLNEAEHGEPIEGRVGTSIAPSEHNATSLKLWRTIPSICLCDNWSPVQIFNVFIVQLAIWLYLELQRERIHDLCT